MPYMHYTRSLEKSKYDGICGPAVPLLIEGGLEGIIYGLLLGLIGFVVSRFVVFPAAALVGAGFLVGFFYGALDGSRYRWLNRRLLSIRAGEDECALGRVAHVNEYKRWKLAENPFDNDYTIHLVLIPHRDDDSKDAVLHDGLQGEHFLRRRFDDLLYEGFDANKPGTPETAVWRWSLHCEFEGSRVATTARVGEVVAPLLGALVIVAVAVHLVWWIALTIAVGLVLVVFVLTRLAEFEGNPAGPGDPEDSASLHVGDYVALAGPAVYDAGHCVGWHEIHPVKRVVKIVGADRQAPAANIHDPEIYAATRQLTERWSQALLESLEERTVQRQRQPDQRWLLHPVLEVPLGR